VPLDGPGTGPERYVAERRKPPAAAERTGKGTCASARQLCMAARAGACGLRDSAAGQERKPDAGASAGDETPGSQPQGR